MAPRPEEAPVTTATGAGILGDDISLLPFVPVGRPLRPVHRGYGAVASRRLRTMPGFSRRRSASSQVIGRAVAVGTSLARRRLVASACGRAVLRGARWLVAQDDHAGVERRGVREFERLADGVIEEPLAFPDHDRIDPDPDVVDEVMVKQRVCGASMTPSRVTYICSTTLRMEVLRIDLACRCIVAMARHRWTSVQDRVFLLRCDGTPIFSMHVCRA